MNYSGGRISKIRKWKDFEKSEIKLIDGNWIEYCYTNNGRVINGNKFYDYKRALEEEYFLSVGLGFKEFVNL